jgi:predicted aldo/keto reductase-like oxidoreductase
MPRRELGQTGAMLSVVGFPGLCLTHEDQAGANAGMRHAFERGVNYFDVAPAYGKNGDCEIKMGIGMQDLPRDQIFLSCKTKRRDRQGAREELERSLKRLKTDHFDLYQCHCFFKPGEVEQMLGEDGAMATILEAKQAGKIRYIGFSAHTTLSAVAALKAFDFDTVMFPINYVEDHLIGFGREVIDLAVEKNVSVISIKPTSAGAWPKDATKKRQWWYRTLETKEELNLALRFALGQKNVISAIPISFLDVLDRAIDAAKMGVDPLTEKESGTLRTMAQNSLSLFEGQQKRALAGDFTADASCPRAYA